MDSSYVAIGGGTNSGRHALMSCVTWVVTITLLSLSQGAFSQSCECPAIATCGPCAGGLMVLELKFNGSSTATITAEDQVGTVFNSPVNAGATFSFPGSLPNDKFVGPTITLKVNGVTNITISSLCGNNQPGDVVGSFTIIAATSKSGGPLCCPASVVETEKPVITNCPSDITVSLPAASCAIDVTWTPPSATDNCTLASLTPSQLPGSSFNVGITTVTYTALDIYGNSSTCSFDVKVVDDTAPVIADCPATFTVAASGNCQATATWTEPTGTDNCSVTITSDHHPGDLFDFGATTVTYTARDPSGNESSCSFDVHVTDDQLPVFTGCPGDITLTTASCDAVATWAPPTATDNCSATVSSSHNPGSTFPQGTTVVTYRAVDPSGNSAACSFKVIVNASAAPQITGCPTDITIETIESGVTATWTEPQATTTCGSPVLTRSHSPGTTFSAGSTTVTYEFTDGSGLRSVCSFNIVVVQQDVFVDVGRVVTPDGDGVNDTWHIGNIEKFADNSVVVVDRWGNVVFKVESYNNTDVVWNGVNENGASVPTGTYFYTIELRAPTRSARQKGFIEVIR